MKYSLLPALLLGTTAFNASAEDAKNLSAHEEVTIYTSAATVWTKVSNFNELNTQHPAVKTIEIVSGKNNIVGALRLLTLQDGGTIKEKLLSYNAQGKTFKYSIVEGALPVPSYVSSLTFKAAGKDKALVVWEGSLKLKDLAATPAEGSNDATAVKVMTSLYRSGLDNLKKYQSNLKII